MTTLKDKMPKPIKRKKFETPVWKGPEKDGITFSLLSRFLVCRERFRLLVVEGLKPADRFNHLLEFGSMWHVCEEALAGYVRQFPAVKEEDTSSAWGLALTNYANELGNRYPLDREQVSHWFFIAKTLFPVYVGHWAKHPDVAKRTPLLQEQVFDVPYSLPSGRTVRLRGKWDSVDFLPAHMDQGVRYPAGIWLQENKSKSRIDPVKIGRQMKFDLQTMLYIVALQRWIELGETSLKNGTKAGSILGVRYNVVHRPAHKSAESMLEKCGVDMRNGREGEWFARWKVGVAPSDVARFRKECLDPVLENLCDDYEWWEACERKRLDRWDWDKRETLFCDHISRHYRHPFGVYNVLDEGGSSELDHYLETGSEAGLQRTTDLFPELIGG